MLVLLNGDADLSAYLKDDPVRPHIPMTWRVTQGREVYGLFEDQYAEHAPVQLEGPRAIICVAYTNGVALEERDLNNTEEPDTAMFYTVWSYDKGAGREIVLQTQKHIQETKKHIFRYVTLSPLTVMAERFHLRNGAHFIRRGKKCQNFEYPSQS